MYEISIHYHCRFYSQSAFICDFIVCTVCVCAYLHACTHVLTHTTLSLCVWSISWKTVAHETILRVHTLSMATYIPVQLAVIHCWDPKTHIRNCEKTLFLLNYQIELCNTAELTVTELTWDLRLGHFMWITLWRHMDYGRSCWPGHNDWRDASKNRDKGREKDI